VETMMACGSCDGLTRLVSLTLERGADRRNEGERERHPEGAGAHRRGRAAAMLSHSGEGSKPSCLVHMHTLAVFNSSFATRCPVTLFSWARPDIDPEDLPTSSINRIVGSNASSDTASGVGFGSGPRHPNTRAWLLAVVWGSVLQVCVCSV